MNVTGVMEKIAIDKRRLVWKIVFDEEDEKDKYNFFLLLAPGVVDEIYNSHSSEKEKTHACSDMYVNCRPESSWEHLTSVLYKKDEITALDQARPFLPPRGML